MNTPGPLAIADAWLSVLSPTAYPVAFAQVHALPVERRRERAALAQVLFAVAPTVAPADLMVGVALHGMPSAPIAQLVAEAEAVAWAAVRDREGLDVPILPASVEARPLRHLFAAWPSAAEWSLWARKAEAARRRS
ncbi:hypothetical protein L6R46_06040 [Myxococcota bacterium]|nr:hypothetical protein [Myxococcota bacterium]